MKKILWESQLAGEIVKNDTSIHSREHMKDSTMPLIYAVLKKYKVDTAVFRQNLQYYSADAKRQKTLMDSTFAYAEKQKSLIHKQWTATQTKIKNKQKSKDSTKASTNAKDSLKTKKDTVDRKAKALKDIPVPPKTLLQNHRIPNTKNIKVQ